MEKKYNELCNKPSDINEHLPTLYRYALECNSVLECGVRGCTSSWAFLYALHNRPSTLILNDIIECDVKQLLYHDCSQTKVSTEWCSDLDLVLEKPVDLVFIDTFHVYGQLKRELAKFAPMCNKYIILHDTEIDGKLGECLRLRYSPTIITGLPYNELLLGLQPAIDEFLLDNPHWKIKEKYENNNGLTILERITQK
jgi:hypothetical protein